MPQFVTGWVQTIYYGLTIRAGDPKPRPGSPQYAAHRRVIQILVVTFYLLYTIYEADHDLRQASHYYADLRLGFNASEKDIKSRFRRLAAVHHPDKSSSSSANDSANYFIHLKLASDTLQDAAKRFAYERFGPSVESWKKCVTIKDYVTRGVLSGILPYYGVGAATVYVLGLFGYMDFGRFYRWLILLTLCVFELHTVTRPHHATYLNVINSIVTTISSHPPYLPFQLISLARKITVTMYIALAQIGPLVQAHLNPDEQRANESEEKALKKGLERLGQAAQALDYEATKLIDVELVPFKADPQQAANLQGKMREWLVQNTIRGDPMVRDALGRSLKKQRGEYPCRGRR